MGVLARAELLLQAKNYSGSGNWLDEANAHDAVNNGALFLPWTGLQHLYLPGLIGNHCSTPDSVAVSVFAGDVEVVMRFTMDDVMPAGSQTVFSNLNITGTLGFRCSMLTTTKMIFGYADGTLFHEDESTVALNITDNTPIWVKVTLDVDDGAGNRVTTIYESNEQVISPDSVTWSQVGDPITTAGTITLGNSDQPLRMGSFNGTSLFLAGRIYRTILRDGIDGTDVFDADFTDVNALKEPFATFVEKSSNAATVTINRASSGRVSTVVDRPMFLFGTDDYFEIPDDIGLDFAAGDDLTVMVAGRLNVASASSGLVTKKTISTSPAGWILAAFAGNFWSNVADGTVGSSETIAEAAVQMAFVAAFVRNTTDDDLEAFKDGSGSGSPTTDATTTTLANADAVFVGASVGPIQFLDGEIHAVVLWREALSDTDEVLAGVELLSVHSDELMMLGVG